MGGPGGKQLRLARGRLAAEVAPQAACAELFHQPVTGFTGADITFGGAAVPSGVTVAETDPFLGTDYTVTLWGCRPAWISFGANAAFNSSDVGNTAPLLYDASVQFNMPPFSAWDDFGIAPSSAPNSPFLHAVNTGSGWSGSWQVQNFNAATYGDGYRLSGAAPAAPSATWTTTGVSDINFHPLGFSGGTTGSDQSSVDEIRFGASFTEVTPTGT